MPIPKPKVEVVFTPEGIEVVRLYGTSWSDQSAAVALFNRLMPQVQQIHELLADAESEIQRKFDQCETR